MAVGDVISDISAIAIGAALVFQPAAGIEVVIFGASSDIWAGIAPNGDAGISLQFYDGVLTSLIKGAGINPNFSVDIKAYIDNNLYLRVFNAGGGVANLCYWGIQTK